MLEELDLKAGHILISVSQGDIRFLNFHFMILEFSFWFEVSEEERVLRDVR